MALLPPRAHGVSAYDTLDQKTGLRRPPTVGGHSLARGRRGEARNNCFELAPSGRVLFVAQSHRARVELKAADLIIANPPFNISDWAGERLRDDNRWQYGAPPAGNANFAWVQHIVHHLAVNGGSSTRITLRFGVG